MTSKHVCKCEGEQHPTYGACLRGKNLRIMYANSANGSDFSAQKRWDKELDLYGEARAAGLQPATTQTADIHAVMDAAS